MKKVIVTKLSRAIRHVVSRGAQGPRGGLWAGWADIPDKPDFDALYDPHGAADAAQGAAAADATAKVGAHEGAANPHAQYALDTDLSGHAGNTENPHEVTKAQVGLGNVDNTSDASKPVSTAQQNALNGKEPTIAAGTSAQFWRGDKTWADFAANVRMTVLTGLSTASASVITAADSVLGAIGKLQAQISDVITQTEAETGTSTTRRSWTSQRVRQATAAWWLTASSALGRTLASIADAAAGRTALGLGSASVLAAGQADAALPTNTDLRAYYGIKYKPSIKPTLDIDWENSYFAIYNAATNRRFATETWDQFVAELGADLTISRAGEQTYFDALGVMRVAAANTLQCDHDPLTGQRLGPYIGGSRTNLCKYSADYTQWTVTEATLEVDTWVAPDGTTARIWVAGTAASPHRLSRTTNSVNVGTSLVSYSWFVYIPPGSDVQRLYLRARSTTGGYSSGQAATLSVTGSGASAAIAFVGSNPFGANPPSPVTAANVIVQALGGGVFRIGVVGAVNSEAAALSTVMDITWTAWTAESIAGTANTRIGIWGWQYEVGGSPSPYIPVPTDASVVRAATTITIGGAKFGGMFNAGQGTFVLQYSKPMREAQLGMVMSVGDGTTQNRMYFLTGNSSATAFDYFEATTAGVGQGSTGVADTAVGRAALSYANNNVVVGKNGVSYTDSTFAVPVVNKLDLGHRDGAAQINGHLTSVTYYPVALSTTPVVELSK